MPHNEARLTRIELKLDKLAEAMVLMARTDEKVSALAADHDQMYERFDVIGEEIFYFLENHSFSNNAVREQYNWNPFTNYKKEGLK